MGHQNAIVMEDIHGTKIKNPHVPFVATLASGFHPGKKIVIEGKAELWHHKRIMVDLACGPAIDENIGMHISLRHDEGVVVFNDKKHGTWGREERHGYCIANGIHIKLKIHAKGDHFKVKVNGRHLCNFHYRRAIADITHLKIEGGIKVHEVLIEKDKHHRTNVLTAITSLPPTVAYQPPPVVQYSGAPMPAGQYPMMAGGVAPPAYAQAGMYPAAPPPAGMMVSGAAAGVAAAALEPKASAPLVLEGGAGLREPGFGPAAGLAIPHIMPFHAPLSVGRQIHISGAAAPGAHEITLSFKNGPAQVAFFVKIDLDQRFLIRNSCQSGSWGAEERHLTGQQFPFTRGQPFKIIILCDHDGYKMAVNGVHMIHFAHRVPFNSVNSLEIRGDLSLANVQVF
jgi:hypothetical protein